MVELVSQDHTYTLHEVELQVHVEVAGRFATLASLAKSEAQLPLEVPRPAYLGQSLTCDSRAEQRMNVIYAISSNTLLGGCDA